MYKDQIINKNIRINLWFSRMVKLIFFIVMSAIIVLLLYISVKGLSELSFSFLTDVPNELEPGGGIGPFLINTVIVLAISLLISIPVGMGAGIYLAEYAKKGRITNYFSICVEALSSVPSIVIGLFGYSMFVAYFEIGFTVLGAAIAVSILNLPIITRMTEESLLMVPRELKEGSYALGATKTQTILSIAIPSALSGIITGITLSACRALGESAIILLVGGTSASDKMWDFSLFGPGGTLPVHLWYIQGDSLAPDAIVIAQKTSAVLIILVLLLTIIIRIPLMIKSKK